MLTKNQFYKTTLGVDAEIVFAKQYATVADVTKFAELTDGAIANIGDFGVFKIGTNGLGSAAATVTSNAALSAANRKAYFVFGSVFAEDPNNAGRYLVKKAAPLWGETIKAENNAYAAPVNHSVKATKSAGTIGSNQEVILKLIETTMGNLPMPTWTWTAKKTGTDAQLLAALAAAVNADKEADWFGAASDATSITITGTNPNRHFKLAVEVVKSAANPTDGGTVFTLSVEAPAFAGCGTLQQVKELIINRNIRDGVSHYYPDNHTKAEEYGLPADEVGLFGATTFDIVVITGSRVEKSPTPKEQHTSYATILVVVPAGGGAAIAKIFE